jgi:hypothetical protein
VVIVEVSWLHIFLVLVGAIFKKVEALLMQVRDAKAFPAHWGVDILVAQ